MPQTDEELMRAYQDGNAQAFEELYSRFASRLEIFFKMRLKKSQRNFLDDLFQVTWLKVHRSRSRFDPKQKFSGWLFSIAINSLRDHLSLSRFKEEVSGEEIDTHGVDSPDPGWRIDFERMYPHFENLSSREREILLLSDLEGFSSGEISQLMDIQEDAVRKLLSRTRQKLRSILKEFEI